MKEVSRKIFVVILPVIFILFSLSEDYFLSSPRKRGSIFLKHAWNPAFAEMTSSKKLENKAIVEFIQKFTGKVRKALHSGNPVKANEMFVKYFNMPRFAKRCLVDYWNDFTVEEQKRFTDLLENNIRKRLREKMLLTKDDNAFVLVTKEVDSRPDKTFWVVNRLNIKKGDFKLVLVLINGKKDYHILDYELEGALLSRNYRGHFNYLIRKYGKKGLFERMEAKLR